METNANLTFDGLHAPFALNFRTVSGLERAILSRKVYHLSFHPYDVLLQPALMKNLDKLLTRVAAKRDQGVLKIMTMSSLAAQLDKERTRLVGTESDLDRQEESQF